MAQLDSASVFGTEGWGFESLQTYFVTLHKSGTYEHLSSSVLFFSVNRKHGTTMFTF